jgi:alpha-L-fucosidase
MKKYIILLLNLLLLAACGEGPNGKKQEYDWDTFYKTIQRLQPKAVMAIMGDDVRWVGNEKGLGRDTEWSATVLTPGIYARSKNLLYSGEFP